MTRRARRLGAPLPTGLVFAVLVIAWIVAATATAAPRPERQRGFYRITASLTSAQTVPANLLAPTTATGQFDALLLRTHQGAPSGGNGECHGIVAPLHSTHPTTKTCTKTTPPASSPPGVHGAPPAGVHWRLSWRLSLSGLSGAATSAAIHFGQMGTVGPVVTPLCGPCGSVSNGIAILTDDQAHALANGAAYVDVGTERSPHGEVRGQIKPLVSLVKPGP